MTQPVKSNWKPLLIIACTTIVLTSCMGAGGSSGLSSLFGNSSPAIDGALSGDDTSTVDGTTNTDVPSTGSDATDEVDALPQASIPLPNLTNSMVSNPDSDDNSVIQGDNLEANYTMVITDLDAEENNPETDTTTGWLRPAYRQLASLWHVISQNILPQALAEDIDTTDTNPCNDGNPAVTCVTIPADGHLDPTILSNIGPDDTLSFAYYDSASGTLGESVTDKPLTNTIYMAGSVTKNSITGNNFYITQTERSSGITKKLKYVDGRMMPIAGNIDDEYSWAKFPGNPQEVVFNKGDESDCDVDDEGESCGHFIVRYTDVIKTYAVSRSRTTRELSYNTTDVCEIATTSDSTTAETTSDSTSNTRFNFSAHKLSTISKMDAKNSILKSQNCMPTTMKLKTVGKLLNTESRLYYIVSGDFFSSNAEVKIRELYHPEENNISFSRTGTNAMLPTDSTSTLAFDVSLISASDSPSGEVESVGALAYVNDSGETILKIKSSIDDSITADELTGTLNITDITDILLFDVHMNDNAFGSVAEKRLPNIDNSAISGRAAIFTKTGIQFIRFSTGFKAGISPKSSLSVGKLLTSSDAEETDSSGSTVDSLLIFSTGSLNFPGIIDYNVFNLYQDNMIANTEDSTNAILVVLADAMASDHLDSAASAPTECQGPCVGLINLDTRDFITATDSAQGLPKSSDPDQNGIISIDDFLNGKKLTHEPQTLFFQKNKQEGNYLIAIGTGGINSTILIDLGLEKNQSITDIIGAGMTPHTGLSSDKFKIDDLMNPASSDDTEESSSEESTTE